ncbi:unnamed protein product [Strongylus vulgaris]|uniref:Uncharacterized protein n=1 Tax=Strongylus vulgaris TaxID=40348 RepID=A0A3P7LRZ3_STRVU|nr:unnamed protein product [Strongylus vulgaris]
MRIKYELFKARISNVITRFLEPTLLPFAILQVPSPEEIEQALLAIGNAPVFGGGSQALAATISNRDTSKNETGAAREVQPPELSQQTTHPSRQSREKAQSSTPQEETQRSTNSQEEAQTFQTLLPRAQQLYQPQYLSTAQEPEYRPKPRYNYLSVNPYPQDYEYSSSNTFTSSSGQYYWPNYPYNSYQPAVQSVQYSPQYYWQQPRQQYRVQQRQPAYYWVYPDGRTYYDRYYPY